MLSLSLSLSLGLFISQLKVLTGILNLNRFWLLALDLFQTAVFVDMS
jgi:hypothetical protein